MVVVKRQKITTGGLTLEDGCCETSEKTTDRLTLEDGCRETSGNNYWWLNQ